MGTASAAMSLVSLDKDYNNLGAKPKKSSLKRWPKKRQMSFHQQSLEEALELRNVNSLENIGPYAVAKKIDRRLSIDVEDISENRRNILEARRKHFQCSSEVAEEEDELPKSTE